MNSTENQNLQKACNKLEIKNVFLADSKCSIRDDFSAENYNGKNVGLQRFNSVIAHGYSSETKEYVFKFSAGIRLLPKDKVHEAKGPKHDEFTLLEVKAKFNVIYQANEELTKEEARVFGEQNCVFNVWPYWREYVQQSCMRMGAPNLPVPMLRHKKNEN